MKGWSLFGSRDKQGDVPTASAPPALTPPSSMHAVDDARVDLVGCRDVLRRLVQVTERFPREYDALGHALADILRSHLDDPALSVFVATWAEAARDVLTTPHWFELLFPDQVRSDTALVAGLRADLNRRTLPGAPKTAAVHAQLGPDLSNALLDELLSTLATGDPAAGTPFAFLSRFYFFRDLLVGYFVDPGLRPIQRAVAYQCCLQRRVWQNSYAADYPYQGLERVGIGGIKPSEERLARYGIAADLKPTDRVLDIGSNNGLWALAVAPLVGHVDGIEYNPFLVAIGNIAKDHLGIRNASFVPADFVDVELATPYDAVFSLANHCTIDGNLAMDFEQYVAKVHSLLKPGGLLFFESHNVFGPGSGGAGDDGDLDRKFDIVERYFEVLRHRMTPSYVPAFDIDKLFVVLRRRDRYDASAMRTFRLAEARQRYAF